MQVCVSLKLLMARFGPSWADLVPNMVTKRTPKMVQQWSKNGSNK
jgi:hypothetical protein